MRSVCRSLVGSHFGMGGIFCKDLISFRLDSEIWDVHDVWAYLCYQDRGQVLGKGSYGTVIRATLVEQESKDTITELCDSTELEQVAVKVIKLPKKQFRSRLVQVTLDEIKILKRIRNRPFLLNFRSALRDQHRMCIVTDLYNGGEMWEHLKRFKTMEMCVRVIYQLLLALEQLHMENIAHLDVKPENIVFEQVDFQTEHVQIRLVDFGSAKTTHSEYSGRALEYYRFGGTVVYCSPEITRNSPAVKGDHLKASDMWSVGVLAYYIATHSHPFWKDSRESSLLVRSRVERVDYDLSHATQLSERLGDFVKRLLVKEPSQRMSASEALQHPWIREYVDNNVDFISQNQPNRDKCD